MKILKWGPFHPGEVFKMKGRFVSFHSQERGLFVWCEEGKVTEGNFKIVATGEEYNGRAIASAFLDFFVFHLVEVY